MAVYKFKLTFEEYEDISRVIEIKSSQTFFEFHKAILDSIGFDQKHMASFYMSNDSWKRDQEITLEDMSDLADEDAIPLPTMKDSRLSMFVNDPHQKMIYVYDYLEMWTMHIELVGIEIKEKTGVKYPVLAKTVGLSPKQYDKVQRFGAVDENEFDEITKNYLNHSDEPSGEISDDEADEFGLFDDGETSEEASGGASEED